MKNIDEPTDDDQLIHVQFQHRIENSLSNKLGIPSIRAGNITIRDERNWRIDERRIEYCWLVNVTRSFVGWCWLFTIKFGATKFRDKDHPEELIQGVFTVDNNGAIVHYHQEKRDPNYKDKVKELTSYDLFDANKGVTLDGVRYEYVVFALNTEVRINLNNPNSSSWKIWEQAVWDVGTELTAKSATKELKEIFTLK